MLTFSASILIKAPIQTVWTFHERPDVLDLLTPPWQPVRIIQRKGGLEVGAITEFEIKLLILPVRWLARHVECDAPYTFSDRQIEGPMQSWLHRHEFTPVGDRTRLTDTIRYELPGGWLAELLLGGWVNSRLRDMFHYRHQVTRERCEALTQTSK
jgi:ligand-binding SRPBCC domain-containing protein